MTGPTFGITRITSIAAGQDNPRKVGTFVEIVRIPHGRTNSGKHYRCTDEQGDFWLVPEGNAAFDEDVGLDLGPERPHVNCDCMSCRMEA